MVEILDKKIKCIEENCAVADFRSGICRYFNTETEECHHVKPNKKKIRDAMKEAREMKDETIEDLLFNFPDKHKKENILSNSKPITLDKETFIEVMNLI